MYYSEIKNLDIADGPGTRVSVFVSGCEFECKGCFNSETWDFENGNLWTDKEVKKVIELGNVPFIDGLTVLGGEPLHIRNVSEVANLVETWNRLHPLKSIWIYTGYTWEALMRLRRIREYHGKLIKILSVTNTLVDGPFVQSKLTDLKFRGSSNQRIIDVQKSIQNDFKPVMHELNSEIN